MVRLMKGSTNMAMKKVTFKFPKALGGCADMLYELREERKKLQQEVDAVEEEEKALKEYIIQTLPKSQASGVAGKLARVTVITKPVPQVQDWGKFYAYVKKHNAFELMQRRLSDQAVKERWEAGKKVPGVEPFNITTVSINKL